MLKITPVFLFMPCVMIELQIEMLVFILFQRPPDLCFVYIL